jgi:putative nucleotide binding protein
MNIPFERRYFEDFAYILDYVPSYLLRRQQIRVREDMEGLAQGIGRDYFTLFELIPWPAVQLNIGEIVFIGRGSDKIRKVGRRLLYEELSLNSKTELENAITTIIKIREKEFLTFFNTSGPISPRMHALETIPGIGKKTVTKILEERARNPFQSFDDLKKRTEIGDPVKLLVEKIMREIKGEDSHILFAKGVQATLEERSRFQPKRF